MSVNDEPEYTWLAKEKTNKDMSRDSRDLSNC